MDSAVATSQASFSPIRRAARLCSSAQRGACAKMQSLNVKRWNDLNAAASSTGIRLAERQARLLGLDSPTLLAAQVAVTTHTTGWQHPGDALTAA
jgi:hypothetical protein